MGFPFSEYIPRMSNDAPVGRTTARRNTHVSVVLEPLFVCIGLVLAVSYRSLEPIWEVGSGLLALGLLTALAYIAGRLAYRTSKQRGLGRAVWIMIIVSQPMLVILWLLGLPVSRTTLVSELALLFCWLAVVAAPVPTSFRAWAALIFAGVAVYPSVGGASEESRTLPSIAQRYVFSNYHDLSFTEYTVLEGEQQNGGAITLLPDGRVLLVAGSGAARILDLSEDLESTPIDLRIPIDVDLFRAQAPNVARFYRVTDVLYSDGRLLATYANWDPAEDCYTLRLAEADFDGSTVGAWTVRFESRPCVELSAMSNESGGRIAVLDPSHILVTVGTFAHTWTEEDVDYGKIFRLDRETWHREVYSRGHRNPQGLLVTGGVVWSTEHGPDGGDELNLIESGLDYGWPFVSYGTDYGTKTLALGGTPGDHSGFEEPFHAWLPSVGISNLISVADGIFPLWEDDLLIGSLGGLGTGRSIFRLRLLDGRTITAERIPTGSTVRDLAQLPQGPLVLWDGSGLIQVIRPADHVFAHCTGCHAVRDGVHGIGPNLWGIVGSPVARHTDYEYSAAMRRYGRTWTTPRLDRFLQSPSDEIPGTTMEHDGIDDPVERAEIIKFLTEIRRSPR
jgi:glucose/arabinose dehydrogenase/protein-S-isoprenylcysteine O-methyltransferase Ste14